MWCLLLPYMASVGHGAHWQSGCFLLAICLILLVLAQALGVGVGLAWGLGLGYVMYKALSLTVGLKASKLHEQRGLDVSEHAEVGYPEFQNQLFEASTLSDKRL